MLWHILREESLQCYSDPQEGLNQPAAIIHQIYLFCIRQEGYRLYIKICRFNYLNCTLLEELKK